MTIEIASLFGRDNKLSVIFGIVKTQFHPFRLYIVELSMEASPSTAIGIDLGTTNSCVAVWKNGQIQIAPSDMGTRTIPSVVSFTDTERIIGVAAKKRMKSNFENTVYDVKRLIGHAYKDPEVQSDMKMWSFKVSESVEGKPVINLKYKKEPYVVSPEQISAMILEQMKKQAEAFLDAKVQKQ